MNTFALEQGRVLTGKYEVVERLGAGWEGEVYRVREVKTGIDRAAKLFFPQRGNSDKRLAWYAKKLHKLRSCPMVIHYQTQETMRFKGNEIPYMVSEYVEGVLLESFVKSRRGGRLTPFEGLHLLHALAEGMAAIHHLNEYHGDLHTENVIVCRYGLRFELKVIDFFHWDAPRRVNIYEDICNLVRILYDVLGGAKTYRNQPQAIKEICCGLKRSLILKKFKTAGQLRNYLELLRL